MPPSHNRKTKQGYYKIINLHKYTGNPANCVFRSSWEKSFMLYCDLNPGVIKWSSESLRIAYVDFFGKKRSYIPDFLIETVSNDPNKEANNRFLIEIKPSHETTEPDIPKGHISAKKLKNIEYSCMIWQKNKHKWAYAVQWCKKHDITFKIITEHQINKLKA